MTEQTAPKKPKAIWELPINYCPSTEEGRRAFRAGLDTDANPYGESSGGVKWLAGWKAESLKPKPAK